MQSVNDACDQGLAGKLVFVSFSFFFLDFLVSGDRSCPIAAEIWIKVVVLRRHHEVGSFW